MRIFAPAILLLTICLFHVHSSLIASSFVYYNGQTPPKIVDTGKVFFDTTSTSLSTDTTKSKTKTVPTPKPSYPISKNSLDNEVTYSAKDSVKYDIGSKKVLLYGGAKVTYGTVNLEAEYIEYFWETNTLYAAGITDKNGQTVGKPKFSEGTNNFDANALRYNFKTGKGKIYEGKTQEGDGYVHITDAKKDSFNNIYGSEARYTTCDADHPHFYIEASKVKMIPNKLMVSGPANLVIAGVRTPLVLPFALFPLQKNQSSGLILPKYGNTQTRGFEFSGLGYYLPIGKTADLTTTADIFTDGSWRLHVGSRYNKRYKYKGGFQVDFARLKGGSEFTKEFFIQRDFNVRANLSLDPKAIPKSRFSASLNFGTSGYNRLNETDIQQHLNNTYSSSISFSRSWMANKLNMTVSANHNQNTSNNSVSLSLPNASVSYARSYPFKHKVKKPKERWYEKINLAYNMSMRNNLRTVDSLLFRPESLEKFEFGVQHKIPVQASFKAFKYFNFSPQVSYTEQWYLKTIEHQDAVSYKSDDYSVVVAAHPDTISRFATARYFERFGASINTTLYGMLRMPKGAKLQAIRHVMRPSASFNFNPDYGKSFWNLYETILVDEYGSFEEMARYPTAAYGLPAIGQRASISFNVGNNIEAKFYDAKDTIDFNKKIKLIENLGVTGQYNFLADSLQLSKINLSGNTRLFDKIGLNFGATYNPYHIEYNSESGTKNTINEFAYTRGKLAILETFNIAANTRFSSKDGKLKTDAEDIPFNPFLYYPGAPMQYPDFDIPWQVSMRYNVRLNKGVGGVADSVSVGTHSLSFDGQLNLTEQWRVKINSGYDFASKDITYTTVQINRDLHCWQMSFRWVPFGIQRSYQFGINVKSPTLKDLKIEKRSNPLDNF